jgi:cytidylate kinase
MAVITISRQYGSEGNEIATRVCKILGYQYFDKALMAQVASEMGLSEADIVDFSEDDYQVRGFLDRLFGRRSLPTVDHMVAHEQDADQAQAAQESIDAASARYVAYMAQSQEALLMANLTVEHLNEEWCVQMIQNIVRGAYERGNVVIVGRGGQAILRDMPGVLHVRVEAPRDIRTKRVQYREMVGLALKFQHLEAEKVVDEHDRAAGAYLRRFYDIDWSDPMHYHVLVNTGKWGAEAAAGLVAAGVHSLRT